MFPDPIFPAFYVPGSYVPGIYFCSKSPMFLCLCSQGPMFPASYALGILCYQYPRFPWSSSISTTVFPEFAPGGLCSQGHMFRVSFFLVSIFLTSHVPRDDSACIYIPRAPCFRHPCSQRLCPYIYGPWVPCSPMSRATSMPASMLLTSYVLRVPCSMCLCSLTLWSQCQLLLASMFPESHVPHIYVSSVLCSPGLMFPWLCFQILGSDGPVFPESYVLCYYVPRDLCFGVYVPRIIYSQSPLLLRPCS